MKPVVILIFSTLAASQSQSNQAPSVKSAPELPEFYDEPTFVVSGVTDYTYRGGHGSDVVVRSTDALANAAASLKKNSNSSENPHATRAEEVHAQAEQDEKRGDSLDAVREYQRAAELDPSESNFFDWGIELLMHRAPEPAIEVFTKGNRLHAGSVRLLLGLAAACYMRGDYERAARYLFEASDLNPGDPTPYMFLGQAQAKQITQAPEYVEKLARFASLDPGNAWANYYYAAALWKHRAAPADSQLTSQVRNLLEKAIGLDPRFAEAYLLLGSLSSELQDLPGAISAYQKAIEANPDLEEAHYRLSQTYELSGQKEKAREELAIYKQLSNRAAEQSARNRTVQRFVFTLVGQNH
jgi:tetratricopeptide (TPR) repeat protein